MDIMNRQKFYGSGRTAIKAKKEKVDINFDLSVLNLMCSYILSENRNIRRSHLINMRNLFEIIDLDLYRSDIEKMKRINFIKKGLEGKLLQNLNQPVLIAKYINGGIIDDDVIDINNFSIMSTEELAFLNDTISQSLNYAFIYNDIDRMLDICTRFKAADYKSRGAIVDEYEALVNESQTKFRRNKAETRSEMVFTLREGSYEEIIKDIHEQVSNPCRKLLSGMQGLNELVGGGFESGRVYMLLGNTGSGKSLTLLDIAIQIKKYNKNYRAKDPTKIPVVVYLTMENTVTETVERLVTMTTGIEDMKTFNVSDLINILKTEGELYLSDDSPIDIIIKYMPDKSVDTGYLYTMTEDLEDEGYEVIAVIQDHIKRIRSCYPQPDLRIELGAIVNEFRTFCAIKDIPLITNSHLNRDGARTIDEGLKNNKSDLIRQLGRANIGESMLMLDNLDCCFIVGPEYDADGNKYMAFSRIKMRYKSTNRDYLCLPYINGNEIKLIEDFYLPVPVFKESLKANPAEGNMYNGNGANKKTTYNNIKEIDEILATSPKFEDDANIFSTSRYRATASVNINQEQEVIKPNLDLPTMTAGRPSQPMLVCPVVFDADFKRDIA